jgi:hypothetical protein
MQINGLFITKIFTLFEKVIKQNIPKEINSSYILLDNKFIKKTK